ncbi:coiled-coil domain-containing protein 13 [Prorops nasuta]|uniref:coiled-coil domain-containing protein 13 n=1 Tax=Prorops nasuta TaxID=863751 RepID=UPI0034CEA7E9
MSALEIASLKEKNDKDAIDYNEILPWTVDFIKEELPEQLILPKEINKFLRNRVRDLIAENGCLRRALDQAEETVQNVSKKITKRLAPLYQVKSTTDVASSKIIQMSRKCRDQAAEIEVLKTKCKKLENNLIGKDESRSSIKIGHEISCRENREYWNRNDESRVKLLNEKLQRVRAKLHKSRNTCNTLKQEINKAQKLICSEVGQNVTINSLSNQPGGWRGRADQIQLLQQKVSELQAKLSELDCSQKTSLEKRNLALFRNTEKERRERIENTTKELRQAEVALETNKKKLEASKARIRVLENELNAAKASIAVLNEKRLHDDHLIEILNGRLKAVEMKNQEREVDLRNKEAKMERERINVNNDLQTANLQIEQLRKKLEEREIEIDKLRFVHRRVQQRIIFSLVKISPVTPYIFLIEFNSGTAWKIIPRLSSPPITPRKLENPSEYVTLALAAENERERLLELVTLLNRRIDVERNEVNSLHETLRNEKNKSAKLEGRLRKLETERVGLARVDSGYKKFYAKQSYREYDEVENLEENRFQLELLREECLVLKARLETVQRDKAADLAIYKQMLEQTRKTFQDACKSKLCLPSDNSSIVTV